MKRSSVDYLFLYYIFQSVEVYTKLGSTITIGSNLNVVYVKLNKMSAFQVIFIQINRNSFL